MGKGGIQEGIVGLGPASNPFSGIMSSPDCLPYIQCFPEHKVQGDK